MTTIAAIRKQLAALLAIVKPAHSLESRVDKLSAEHREIYERYSERMAEFIAHKDIDTDGNPGNAYRLVADGYGPQLPARIANALYPMPTISKNASDEQAAQIWFDEVQK